MSTVNGSISVNVEFRDSTSTSGVQSLKTIALRDTTEYTTGKVAIVTGTVANGSEVAIVHPFNYRNASGATFTMTVQRVAFQCDKDALFSDGANAMLRSNSNRISVGDAGNAGTVFGLHSSGTATWTLVFYGT